MGERLCVEFHGSLPYDEGLALQRDRAAARRAGRVADTLLLLEHPPVVTLGRSARPENLRASRAELASRGVALREVARGGDVTYHGPGQLVGYPIFDLASRGRPDVGAYLRSLESTLMDALGALGLASRGLPGLTGVFAAAGGPRPRKLASIGVAVRSWVTSHGFALNVDVDLSGFELIVPCGLDHVDMTSVARELGDRAPADLPGSARKAVAEAFARRWA